MGENGAGGRGPGQVRGVHQGRGGILLHNQEEMNLTKLQSCVQVEDNEENIFC